MELNETLAKIDLTLDSTVKKIEKQAKEIVNQELKIELSAQEKSTRICSLSSIGDVIDYIKSFRWEDTKYPRNKSLLELTGMITDVTTTIYIQHDVENENNWWWLEENSRWFEWNEEHLQSSSQKGRNYFLNQRLGRHYLQQPS